ncbi:DUF7522 family protein [Salarchaeum japonicum]|uniref:DUF7522 family protein n=1 Tax=Salarchaeum japonicum TaxID=555573 RepID=UPI003C75166C
MDGQYEELVEYCQRQAGDSFQSAFTYTENSADPYYVRPDMKGAFAEGGLEEFREAAWGIHTTVLKQAPKASVLGEYQATVHTFETAFAIQFRTDADTGIVLTFDRNIGRNLHGFLMECERYL